MGFSRQEYWSGLPLPSLVTGYNFSQISMDVLIDKIIVIQKVCMIQFFPSSPTSSWCALQAYCLFVVSGLHKFCFFCLEYSPLNFLHKAFIHPAVHNLNHTFSMRDVHDIYIYIYTHIHTHTYTKLYIYIYIYIAIICIQMVIKGMELDIIQCCRERKAC